MNILSKKIFLILAFTGLLCIYTSLSLFAETRRFGLNYLQENFQLFSKDEPLFIWANAIFEPMAKGIETIRGAVPKLAVTKGRAPFSVFTLADGYVVVSEKALRFCKREPKPETALAFILGHELAHLAKSDLWHLELIMDNGCIGFTGKDAGEAECHKTKNQYSSRFSDSYKLWEIEADRMGVIYAAMAGYDVSKLLSSPNNFFEHFIRSTSRRSKNISKGDLFHPPPEVRLSHSRKEIEKVLEELEIFDLGVLHSLIGEEDYAIALFDRFLRSFPSREVLTNIGVLHLRKALSYQPSEFHWILTVDPESQAHQLSEQLVHRGTSHKKSNQDKFDFHVAQASRYFQKALTQDVKYIPAQAYLGVACCLQGRSYTQAIGYFDIALQEVSTAFMRKMLYNNRGLAYWYYSQDQMKKGQIRKGEIFLIDAINDLKQAVVATPDDVLLYHNLGLIYNKQGQDDLAKAVQAKATQNTVELGDEEDSIEEMAGLFAGMPVSMFRKQNLQAEYAEELVYLEGMQLNTFRSPDSSILAYSAKNNFQARIHLLVATQQFSGKSGRKISIGDASGKVKDAYGDPDKRIKSNTFEYWVYDNLGIGFQFQKNIVIKWFLFVY